MLTVLAPAARAQDPFILAQPANRSVLEGGSHTFDVSAGGTAPFAYQWLKGGAALSGQTNASLVLTAVTTNDAADYTVVVTNGVGSVTSAVARLTVRLLSDPVYPAPQGGWTYRYAGEAAATSLTAGLDGTWNRQNSLDAWAGDGRGAGNGTSGGLSISNGVLTIEDAKSSGSGFDNRRIYFTRDLGQDGSVTNAGTLMNDGVTLTFRARLTPSTDPLLELTGAPLGWVNNSDGKGVFGLRQGGAGGMLVGFSLNTAIEDTGASSSNNLGQAGLHFNNLNGDVRSSFVDPGEGGTLSLLPLDPTVFHEFWITIQDNGAAPGTHVVSIYLDGAKVPSTFNITAGTGGPDGPSTNYLALGLGNQAQRGAVDIDFFGYRPGVLTPSGYNESPGFVQQPQGQFVSIGAQATFTAIVTGTPPFSVQWYRDGAMVPGATNLSHTTPPVGTNDQFAAYTVVVSNASGAVTSAPPALVLLLAPPILTAQPASQTVTNGGAAALAVAVNSATTPTYQWRFNGAAIPGATAATLARSPVGPADAGGYDVVVQNSSGSVTSAVATLTVLLEDFGDAPGAGYATLRANGGARHLLVPGFHLGVVADGELDGQPALLANGDDLGGVDDEDGVRFVSGPFIGGLATIEVVASAPGVLNAWLDLDLDGSWAQAGEQVVTNAALVAGTNVLQFPVPATATVGNSYARFRFASVGGLSFGGPAADGEVEDYLAPIVGAANIGIVQAVAPAVVVPNQALVSTFVITNAGPSLAGSVLLTNQLPAGVTFVSALPSQGSCAQAGGVVTCELGLMLEGADATVVVTVNATTGGTLTNRVSVGAAEYDPVLTDNSAAILTVVAQPPVLVAQPQGVSATNGATVNFSATVTGTAPLAYQWRRDGVPVPGGTNLSLVLTNVSAASSGSYTLLVTNLAGSAVSDPAVLTVLVPPFVVAQPQSRTNLAGSSATFAVTAGGTAPLSYQWLFPSTNVLSGQTSPSLSLASVQLTNAGAYRVVISNAYGMVTSAPASLVVLEMDLGDAQGAGFPTLLTNDGARHLVVPGIRLGALIDFEADGQPDAGALGDDVSGVDDDDGVILPASMALGQAASVSVIASTNGVLQAWIDFDRDGSWAGAGEQIFTNRVLVPGTNVLVFQVPATALAGSSAARFRFSTTTNLAYFGAAPDGEVEDYLAVLSGEADLAIARVSAPAVVAVGANYAYAVTVTNIGPASVGGVSLTNVLAPGVELVSAVPSQGSCSLSAGVVTCALGGLARQSAALITLTVVPTLDGSLTNVVSVGASSTDPVPANNVQTTVVASLEAPAIVTPPASQAVTNGGTAQFAVVATGTDLRYQWRLAATNLPAATNFSLVLANVQTANAGLYSVVITNAVGAVTSAPATLSVLVPLTITGQPAGQTVARGTTVTLSVGVTGSGPISYQWEVNGVDLPDGLGASLVLTNIQSSQAGTYRVRVTNPLGTVISANAVVTVIDPPSFTVQPQGSTNLVGASATLTGAATGTSPLTYQWYFNQTNVLAGQTNTSLSLVNLQLTQSGNYTLVASNPGGSSTSQVALVLVIEMDFGDAPESVGYPTTLTFNGARHRILPGIRLGALIDRESDGQPSAGATGDNANGSADEDGVTFGSAFLRGYSTPVQVVASTNGFLDAWVDFNINGTWVDSGEQVFASQPVVAGTNFLSIAIPGSATPGGTYARFRFSTAGGLGSFGPAPDGEVEDYFLTVQQAADLVAVMTDTPDPVQVLSNVVYTIAVTNLGPAPASTVTLTNILPSGVTFVSVGTSIGSCSQTSGVVRCSLGNFVAGTTGLVTVTVRANVAGTLSNACTVYTTTAEGALANNIASQITRVFTPATTFSNPAAMTVADATASAPGLGIPYPSTLLVSGLTGVVHKVTVSLLGLSHTYADDLDVLLVAPGGQTVFLLSDVGGNTPLAAVNLTLDDDAELGLPNTGTIVTGSYRPTTFESGSDTFPAPAPAAPFGATLSTLQGINPNGTWSLYVMDDLEGDVGNLAGGWQLSISTGDAMADIAAGLTVPVGPSALGSNLVFTAYATNRGPAAASQVRLTNTIPAGVTFVSAVPAQGACTNVAGTISCALGPVAPGAAVPVTVTVLPLAVGSYTNRVSAGAGEFDFTPANNTTAGAGLVRVATDLAVIQSTATNLFLLSNDVVYTVVVTNRGPNAATAVAATDLLPSGVTFVSATTSRGSCAPVAAQVDCAIGSLAAAEAAIITVRVRPNAVGQFTNVVSSTLAEVDSAATNNIATNVISVAVFADLALAMSGGPDPVALNDVVTYVATVTNRGPSTAASVVLTNPIPASSTFVSAAPGQGSCANVAGVIRCDLGSVPAQGSATVILSIRPGQAGLMTNVAGVASVAIDGVSSNNVSAVTVAVEVPPSITAGPAGLTVTNGGSASFQVTAAGTAPLRYQWRRDGVELAGATNATLLLPGATYAARGAYSVVVSNRVGVVTSAPATLVVLVPPTISDIADQQLNEDQAGADVPFTVLDVDDAASQLTVTAESSNPSLLPAANIVLGGTDGARTVRVTPLANQFGSAVVTLTVRDPGGLTAIDAFVVTVAPVNDAPTLDALSDLALVEDFAEQTVALAGIGSGAGNEVQTLSITAQSSDPSILPHPTVTYSSPAATGSLTLRPAANAFGTVTVSVTVADGGASNNTVVRAFTVTIAATNDAPIIAAVADQALDEDGALAVNLAVSDVDGPATNIVVGAESSAPGVIASSGLVVEGQGTNRVLRVTPVANASGTAVITVSAVDAEGASNRVSFVVTVRAVNDVPTLDALADIALGEDFPDQPVVLSGVGTGAADEVQTLTVTAVSSNPSVLPHPQVMYSSPDAAGSLVLKSAPNASGVAIVSVTVSDGGTSNQVVVRTFTVTVSPSNDVPVVTLVGDRVIDEDASLAVPLAVSDVDGAAGDVVFQVSSTNPSMFPVGALRVTGGGGARLLEAIPATNAFGAATITVTAVDSDGGTNQQSFVLTVQAVNDAPTIGSLPNLLFLENDGVRTVPIGGIATGATNEADVLVVSAVSSDPSILPNPVVDYLSPAANGSLSLAPAAGRSGVVTVTVTVDDGGSTNRLATRQFAVTIVAEADRPVISAVEHNAGVVSVTFGTRTGFVYVLERAAQPAGGSWVSLAPVAGTGASATVTDSLGAGPAFYRLRLQLP